MNRPPAPPIRYFFDRRSQDTVPGAFRKNRNDVGNKSSVQSSAAASAFLLTLCRSGRRLDCDIFNRGALNEVMIRFAYDLPSVMSGTGVVVAADGVSERTGSTVGQNGFKWRQDVDE